MSKLPLSNFHSHLIFTYLVINKSLKYYLVTEWFEGVNLFEYLESKKKIKEELVAKIIYQVLRAVKYMHSINICHRDLKLDNVMINRKTHQIKIIDFGYSKYCDDFTVMKTQIGTPYYLAPEIIEGKYTKSCDLWSIGVMTYCMLVGEPPFVANNIIELYDTISRIDKFD